VITESSPQPGRNARDQSVPAPQTAAAEPLALIIRLVAAWGFPAMDYLLHPMSVRHPQASGRRRGGGNPSTSCSADALARGDPGTDLGVHAHRREKAATSTGCFSRLERGDKCARRSSASCYMEGQSRVPAPTIQAAAPAPNHQRVALAMGSVGQRPAPMRGGTRVPARRPPCG
jgi:hypothetical protein